jgi:hypothetical protein
MPARAQQHPTLIHCKLTATAPTSQHQQQQIMDLGSRRTLILVLVLCLAAYQITPACLQQAVCSQQQAACAEQ